MYRPYSDSPALIPGDVCRPTTDCADGLAAADCTEIELLRLLDASTTHSTKRSYESDLRHFVAFGGSVPATPIDVARYLAAYAGCLSVATLARRLVAIGQAHAARGLLDPTKSELVRRTMRGVRRTYGAPQRRALALTRHDLVLIASSLDFSVKDIRDRALLLVGFAGAFRRCELVAINCNLIRSVPQGLLITIPRGKSDQEGRGREVVIPHGRMACPVRALDVWLSASGITDGPVFRAMRKGGRVGPKRLSPDAVAKIVKERVKEAGLDSIHYSGYSLRAGFATSAAAAGIPTWRIKAQTGHASDAMLGRYIRHAALFDRDALPTVL